MTNRVAARLGRLAPWVRLWPYLVVTVAFVVSRIIYRGAFGVRFDGSPLFYFIQYIDPWFFENDFLRSVVYLHQQAPLPNFVIGCAWLLFGPSYAFVFLDAVFLAFGLTLGLAMIAALERLGVRRLLAVGVVVPLLVSPIAVIYECWLFYHTPVAALMCCALVALLRYYRSGSFRAALLFFSLLALVALIRNVYGALWLGAVAAGVFVVPPLVAPAGSTARRTVLKAAIVPLLVLMANNAKTSLLLGRGFGDAAIWTNIVTKTWEQIPGDERERLLAEGHMSHSIKYEPFQGVDSLGDDMRVRAEPTGVPLLDMAETPNGRGNTHTLEYLLIAERFYKPDGKFLLKHYPEAYAKSVKNALTDWYLSAPTRDIVLPRTQNYKRLAKLENRLEKLAGKSQTGRLTALAIAIPTALAYAAYRLLRTRARLASERSTVAAVIFMSMTISYAALGTTLVSYADFSRYRFDVDPFYVILLAMLLMQAGAFVVRQVRRRRAPAPAPLLAGFVVLSACGNSQPAVTQCPQCPVCPEVAAATATATAETTPPPAITAVPLDVPKPAAGADHGSQVVTIARDGKLFLGGRPVSDLSALKVAIQEVAAKNPDVRVAIEADKDVTHGQVIAAIDAIKQAGVNKVAFATAPTNPPAKR